MEGGEQDRGREGGAAVDARQQRGRRREVISLAGVIICGAGGKALKGQSQSLSAQHTQYPGPAVADAPPRRQPAFTPDQTQVLRNSVCIYQPLTGLHLTVSLHVPAIFVIDTPLPNVQFISGKLSRSAASVI